MIGQRTQAQSAPAALRRVIGTASRGPGHGGAVPPPSLRAIIDRVLAAMARPAGGRRHGRRPRPQRPGRWVHEAPPVIREPESAWWEAQAGSSEAAVTVAVVGESETSWGADAVVSRLAELAVHDELLIVYGSGTRPQPGHHAVMAGLRGHLPRHHVVALHVAHDGGLRHEAAIALEQFLEDGSLPVVVTPVAAVPDITAEISSYLRADRVVRVSRTTTGADLHQVWRRHAAAHAN